MSILVVIQIIVAVTVNWIILWLNSTNTVSQISITLRNELSQKTASSTNAYLANASSANLISYLRFQYGLENLSNISSLSENFWVMMNTFSIAGAYFGVQANGNFIGYGIPLSIINLKLSF